MPRQSKFGSEGLKDSWRVAALQSTSDGPLNWVQVSMRIVAAMTTAVSRYMKSALSEIERETQRLAKASKLKGKAFSLELPLYGC